jgi:hypothetical protein
MLSSFARPDSPCGSVQGKLGRLSLRECAAAGKQQVPRRAFSALGMTIKMGRAHGN